MELFAATSHEENAFQQAHGWAYLCYLSWPMGKWHKLAHTSNNVIKKSIHVRQ